MQIFVDMDGVLADFDTGYELAFGTRPSKTDDNVDWAKVRAHKGFYENLPPMRDMRVLWAFLEPFQPIILTGVPSSVEEAPYNKRVWARKQIGDHVKVRCCRSSEKCQYASPGDVLIDDWEKYRGLWLVKGGHWITYHNARQSIQDLADYLRMAF